MYPSASVDNSYVMAEPSLDDTVALSSKYDTYHTLSGTPAGIREIGGGADGSVWAISSEAFGDGYRVLKASRQAPFGGLEQDPSWVKSQGGGMRIAVDTAGQPWLTTRNGSIFHATSWDVNTGWQLMAGNGADIATGYDGSVWVIGGWCGTGDCPIYKWDPSIQNWVGDASGGLAVRIAVGHDGVPWVINSARNIYRYSTNDPHTGFWQQMPGMADDLAIGPGRRSTDDEGSWIDIDYVWSIARSGSGKVNLSVWNEQYSTGGAPGAAGWTNVVQPCSFDSTSAVAVGLDNDYGGEPYIACNGGHIIRPYR
jgi:hypothetical protein